LPYKVIGGKPTEIQYSADEVFTMIKRDEIKFIDLGIGKDVILKETDVQDLGLDVIQANINSSRKEATFTKAQDKTKKMLG